MGHVRNTVHQFSIWTELFIRHGILGGPNTILVPMPHKPHLISFKYCMAPVVGIHDDVIKWKHFPRNWPFVRGIHRSRWIPNTKASDAELWCFLWSASE